MDFETIVADVNSIIAAVAPVIDIALPAAAPAIQVASKIMQGISAGEPTAVALYNQIKGGAAVTSADLAAAIASYDEAFNQLDADLVTAIQAAQTSAS